MKATSNAVRNQDAPAAADRSESPDQQRRPWIVLLHVAVTPARLRATTSYGIPDFVQRAITRIGLSVARIAALKKSGRRRNSNGGMNRLKAMSGRLRCVSVCRQSERARKAEARRIHGGIAMKRARPSLVRKSHDRPFSPDYASIC